MDLHEELKQISNQTGIPIEDLYNYKKDYPQGQFETLVNYLKKIVKKNKSLKRESENIYPKMITDKPIEIPNSSWVIVAVCELDGDLYGALVNRVIDEDAYGNTEIDARINEIRMNMARTRVIDEPRRVNNDVIYAIISNFFSKNMVFEMNKIPVWIWKTIDGVPQIPKGFYERAEKKRKKPSK